MKKILFISDAFLGGGLETRIIEQIKVLKSQKIKAFLLCRELNNVYSKNFVSAADTLIVKPSKKSLLSQSILNDVDTICNFCIENDIDFIDCNPFWCALPAALAANKLKIPISFTLHGVISANFIAKENLAAQTLYDTTFSYGFNQIFAVAEYLTEIYSYLPNTSIIRNGLPINRMESQSFKNTKKIAVASRLDEPKTKLILDFLPTLYESKAINQIDIYGKGDHSSQLESFISQNNMTDKVKLCGWTNNFPNTLKKNDYMLAFGMGRVVLEAMKSGVPVGILGYGGFAGLINRNNLIDFAKNNLTSWQESPTDLPTELQKLFKKPSNYFFKSSQLSIFNNEAIWKKYLDIVNSLKYIENPILDSLYSWLLQHPASNVFTNHDLFLYCIRILSDGNHPISPRLFYNIFQDQMDKNHDLVLENEKLRVSVSQLQQEVSLSLKEIAKKRIKTRLEKTTRSDHHT